MASIDKKYYSQEITKRFLKAMDAIISDRENGKVTARDFGETVGMAGSNITRLRDADAGHSVTVEAIAKICLNYDISPSWLILGDGEMYDQTEKSGSKSSIALLEKAVIAVKRDLQKNGRLTKRVTKVH